MITDQVRRVNGKPTTEFATPPPPPDPYGRGVLEERTLPVLETERPAG